MFHATHIKIHKFIIKNGLTLIYVYAHILPPLISIYMYIYLYILTIFSGMSIISNKISLLFIL